jgi:beta-xylosidase
MYRKIVTVSILLAVYGLCPSQQTGRWGDQGDGSYRNPVIAGNYRDPDVVRVGENYYMVASTFESSPGITVLQSKDLVNWKQVGAVFGRYNKGVFAPSIRYHDGRFCVFVNLLPMGSG